MPVRQCIPAISALPCCGTGKHSLTLRTVTPRHVRYSFIIPVYNRPGEVGELLASLEGQTVGGFEVIVVEDGSDVLCEDVVAEYAGRMDVKYIVQPNGGPGCARNHGAERATGEYLLILDSDCVLPPGYLRAVEDELAAGPCEAFGGPDCAHESFTAVQRAINYSMTSFLTTGGIRGGKRKLDRFYPRSFNMGVRRDLYGHLGGFGNMRFGEDIDFSIRIFKSGASCRLFPGAWVWHKRRTDLRHFFRQVYNSGMARVNLYKRHPESLRAVHLLPALFTAGTALLLLVAVCGLPFSPLALLALLPLVLYALLVFAHSRLLTESLRGAPLSAAASFTQLVGYGAGCISAWWRRCVLGRAEELQAFRNTFYK